MSKQILFRLDDNTAKALEKKLTDKGITKQFLFSKVVELFIKDKLSLDSNSVEKNLDNKKIAIDNNEVAEIIKERYLNELVNLLSIDSSLVNLVAEKVVNNIKSNSQKAIAYIPNSQNEELNWVDNEGKLIALQSLSQEFKDLKTGEYKIKDIAQYFINPKTDKKYNDGTIRRWMKKERKCPFINFHDYVTAKFRENGHLESIKKIK